MHPNDVPWFRDGLDGVSETLVHVLVDLPIAALKAGSRGKPVEEWPQHRVGESFVEALELGFVGCSWRQISENPS